LGLDLRLEVVKRGFKSDLGFFFRFSVVVDGGGAVVGNCVPRWSIAETWVWGLKV
jgi:hypothetical protein